MASLVLPFVSVSVSDVLSSFFPSSSTPTPTPTPTPTTTTETSPDPTPTPTPSPSSSSTTPAPSTSSLSSSLPSSSSSPLSSSDTSSASTTPTPGPSSTPTSSSFASDPPLSSAAVVLASSTISSTSPSPTATTSSSGFFADTGAVAGTFTAVGLIAVAGVIAVALLVLRRRTSRSHEDDMDYLDRAPDFSSDPPMTQLTSVEDGAVSDHSHYGPSPLVLPSPPAAYNAYAFQPQAYSPDTSATRGYPSPYPPVHPQAQPIYYPDAPNTHPFAVPGPGSTPVQTVPPNTLRPTVRSPGTVQKQWSNTRFSVDSFYVGIATDNQPAPGRAF